MIALHWAFGALALAALALGGYMTHGSTDAAERFDLYQLHKSLGFTALALLVARFVARAASVGAATPKGRAWERRAGQAAHFGLYGLSLVALLSGWLVVSTAIVPIPTRLFDAFVIPNIPGVGAEQFAFAKAAHFYASWTLAALVAVHVGAALKHHFVDRDDVLIRMLPKWRNLR